ncbi:MAG: S9 family peptidase [Polyangiaceae bacterium]|nr:S9 family peptidase [Polyangiaceae bacterium]
MKTRTLALLAPLAALALVAACEGEPPPATPAPPPATAPPPPVASAPPRRAPQAPVALEEYFKIRRAPAFSRSGLSMVSFSHDEKLVAYASDEAGRIDVWVKPITGEGRPTQVTHSEGFVHSIAFSPTADLLVFEADRGGDELPRLFATDSKGSPPRELVPELPAGRRTQFVEWADDGKTFLYQSSGRDEKYLDLVEYDVASKRSTVLWQGSGKLSFAATSRDHKRFVLAETHSDVNSDLYLFERGAKAPVLLTKHTGDVNFAAQAFSKDKKTLHLTSDENGEFTELFALDMGAKKRTLALKDKWDVEGAGYSQTFKYFIVSTNEDGSPKTLVRETATNRAIELPPPPGKAAWVPVVFSKTDRYLGVTLSGDEAPSTIYVVDLTSGAVSPVIDVLPPSLRGRPMIAGESVRIPSFDGRDVPAFLYRPSGPGPFPAIIDVHGGPTAQSRRAFALSRQYFLSKGYAVLVPNVRGSTGYGKSYTKLDNLDLGGGPLKDVVACKQWLVQKANVAPDKVVVMGGSYGGYMALAAEAFTPDEFVANVDFFGVSDLKTLVESFPPYWASSSGAIYQKFGDPKNPDHAKYQHDRSPAHFVEAMKRPLLVVQGDKDARVKKDQSDRIVEALKRRHVPVHYLVLENEGHGFTKTENNLRALKLTDRFLDRYVFGDETITDLP